MLPVVDVDTVAIANDLIVLDRRIV